MWLLCGNNILVPLQYWKIHLKKLNLFYNNKHCITVSIKRRNFSLSMTWGSRKYPHFHIAVMLFFLHINTQKVLNLVPMWYFPKYIYKYIQNFLVDQALHYFFNQTKNKNTVVWYEVLANIYGFIKQSCYCFFR